MPTPKAAKRVLESFTAQINNDHTRVGYLNAMKRSTEWCETHRLRELVDVEPIHIGGVRQRPTGALLAADGEAAPGGLRMFFDWLVTGIQIWCWDHCVGAVPSPSIVLLLPRHSNADGVLGRDEVIGAFGRTAELHTFDHSVERVAARTVILLRSSRPASTPV